MKKVLLFTGAFLALSCSGSDDSATVNNSLRFNPPQWVQGTWVVENASVTSGLKFTSDDICSIAFTSENCYKETLNIANNNGSVQVNVTEDSDDDSYFAKMTIAGNSTSFSVDKVSATKINWHSISGDIILTKKQ